jgi:hypothetical protein
VVRVIVPVPVKAMSKGQGLSGPESTWTVSTGTISTVGCWAAAVAGRNVAATASSTVRATQRVGLMAYLLGGIASGLCPPRVCPRA